MSRPLSRNNLTFFDKVIHVTFYSWVDDPETKTSILTQACSIRSDNPPPGFKYFQRVQPPTYDTARQGRVLYANDDGSLDRMANEKDYLAQVTRHYGMKPNMRLQLQQLPETVCTSINLTIENLDMEIDIGEFTAMYIEAGYAYSNGEVELMSRFYAGIFSSYIETPNPGGRTVFTGIVGNWFVKGMRAQPHVLVIYEGEYTVKDFVSVICSFIGITPHIELTDPVANYVRAWKGVNREPTEDRAQSAYQVIDWLAKELMGLTYELRGAKTGVGEETILTANDVVAAYFHDNVFYVSQVQKTNREDNNKVAVNLNKISNASFEGGKLTITAPWNPKLVPGQLFYMEPTYFRGRLMPKSTLREGVLKDEADLYRPITIDVMFETVGRTNQMKVMAIKANLAEYNTDKAAQEEALKADQTVNYTDDDGKVTDMTQRQASDHWRAKAQEEQQGTEIAAFYAGTDPYSVGIFTDPQYGTEEFAERERRRKNGDTFNKKNHNNDVVITVDYDTIETWNNLTNPNRVQQKKETGNRNIPDHNDPARISKNWQKVSLGGEWGEVPFATTVQNEDGTTFLSYNDFGDNWVSLAAAGLARGLLPEGQAIKKDRPLAFPDWETQEGNWDWVWTGTKMFSKGIPVRDICYIFAALGSWKGWADDSGFSGAVTKDTNFLNNPTYWPGSLTHMAAPTVDWTGPYWPVRYPTPTYESGFQNLYIPKMSTGKEFGDLIEKHKDYLLEARDYIGIMGSRLHNVNNLFPNNANKFASVIPSILYNLTCIIEWQRLWPKSPWCISIPSGWETF